MKKLSLFILFASFSLLSIAQKTDKSLDKKINALISTFNGEVGVFVKDLQNNNIVSINADTIFPTASIVKIPILIGIMNKIHNNELDYHQKLTWYDTLNYDPGEDIVAYLKQETKIELSKVMMLMMTISDNTGSLWLQRIAGTGATINQLLAQMGYTKTRINSRTPGRETDRSVYGWGQTSPAEMARIVEDIVNRKIISPEACDRMLRIMGRQYWDEEGLSSIPPDVFVASKNGAVNASRSEVMYVKGKHPYILSIFTKNNKDTSWDHDNEAWVLTRQLSKIIWDHFN